MQTRILFAPQPVKFQVPPSYLTHPDRTEREYFIGYQTQAEFDRVHWQTRRMGNRVFDDVGKLIEDPNRRPVFVSKREMRAFVSHRPRVSIEKKWPKRKGHERSRKWPSPKK